MTNESTPIEMTGEKFDGMMDIVAPVCLDVIQVIINVCIDHHIAPILGLSALIELTEHNLESNKPDLPEGVDDGQKKLREWIKQSIKVHLSGEPGTKIMMPPVN